MLFFSFSGFLNSFDYIFVKFIFSCVLYSLLILVSLFFFSFIHPFILSLCLLPFCSSADWRRVKAVTDSSEVMFFVLLFPRLFLWFCFSHAHLLVMQHPGTADKFKLVLSPDLPLTLVSEHSKIFTRKGTFRNGC